MIPMAAGERAVRPLPGGAQGSARSLAGGVERGAVEDEPVADDLAVGHGDALGGGSAGYRDGRGVVHDDCGLLVTERRNQFRAGENLNERAHEAQGLLPPLQPARGGIADDVLSDVLHRLVQVVAGPRVEVGQGGTQRRVGGFSHGGSLFLSSYRSVIEVDTAARGNGTLAGTFRRDGMLGPWSRPSWNAPRPAKSRRSARWSSRTAGNCRCTATG